MNVPPAPTPTAAARAAAPAHAAYAASRPYASFGMYPFPRLVPAWERLWAIVHRHAPWTPDRPTWSGAVQDHWRDPACRVAHVCGWPVAAQLGGVVEVVAAFGLDLPDADGHRYRSVLLARDPAVLDRLDGAPETSPAETSPAETSPAETSPAETSPAETSPAETSPAETSPAGPPTAAANSDDSLSGWISLLAAVGRPAWPGPVHWTGAHVASLAALRAGTVDVACIDALTLAHLRDADPTVDAGLVPVGRGPWIPGPAVVVRPGTSGAERRALLDGLRAAVADPTVGGPLRYRGVMEPDPAEYDATTRLVPPPTADPVRTDG